MMKFTARSSNRSLSTTKSKYQQCQLLCLAGGELSASLCGWQGWSRGCPFMVYCPQLCPHHRLFTGTSCRWSEGQRVTLSWMEQELPCSKVPTVLSVPQGGCAAWLAAPQPAHRVLPPFQNPDALRHQVPAAS